MSVISILIVILVVGFLLWVVNTKIPMDSTVNTILNIVVVLGLIIWLLKAFGIWGNVLHAHV